MNKLYRIFFWAGMDTSTHSYSQIVSMCSWNPNMDAYIFAGSLDDFVSAYEDKFIFLPSEDEEYDVIAVTHKKSFGQQ